MNSRRPAWPLLALLVLVLLSTGLKLVHLRADAPRLLPNGFSSSAPVKDEAAKSYEARNRALFGHWTTSPADDYRYWNTLSPAWTHSLMLWFKLFGVSYPSLRLFSIFWSALAVLILWRFFPPPNHQAAGPLAAILYALNFYLLIYGRLGLIETALNTLILLGLALLLRARARPRLFPLAAAVFYLAFLFKQSAAAFFPLLALAAILAPAGRRRTAWLSLFILLAASAALFLWPDYWLRSVMNFRHALGWRPDATHHWMLFEFPVTRQALAQAFGSIGFLRGYLLMMPVAGTLALLEIIVFCYRGLQTRAWDRPELILIAGLLCARLVLAVSPHTVVRFYLIQFPPACLLAGLLLQRILLAAPDRSSAGNRRLAVASLIALALLFNLVPYLRWLRDPAYQIQEASQALQKTIGPGPAVLIGEWAAPLSLETPYRTYYVKNIFNRRPEQLMQFGITHLLFSDPEADPAIKSFRQTFPGPFEQRELLLTLPLFEETLTLSRVQTFAPGTPP